MGVNAEIRIFITGGTFDKEYDELTGRLYAVVCVTALTALGTNISAKLGAINTAL